MRLSRQLSDGTDPRGVVRVKNSQPERTADVDHFFAHAGID